MESGRGTQTRTALYFAGCMYTLSMQSLENLILVDVFEPDRKARLGTSRMQSWHRVNKATISPVSMLLNSLFIRTYHGLYARLGGRFMISTDVETLDISK